MALTPLVPPQPQLASPPPQSAPPVSPLATDPELNGGRIGGSNIGGSALNAVIIIVVLALIGIPILFGLQHLSATSPTPTAAPPSATRVATAAPPNGMLSYLGGDYSIAYPSAWTRQQVTQKTAYGTAQVDTFSQDAGTVARVFTLPSIPSDLLETGIDSVSGTVLAGAVPQPTSINQQATYNGVQWLEDDYTVKLVVGGQEVPEQMRVLGANLGLTTYVIVLIAPQSSFAATNTSAFEPMLQSVRLG